MALIYKMRAIAQSNSEYVFWTDSEPDIDGSNAPEAVVLDSIVVNSIGGTAAAEENPIIYEKDFSTLSSISDIGTGIITIDGVTWYCWNNGSANKHRIVNGEGIRLYGNYSSGNQTGSHLGLDLAQFGNKITDGCELWADVSYSGAINTWGAYAYRMMFLDNIPQVVPTAEAHLPVRPGIGWEQSAYALRTIENLIPFGQTALISDTSVAARANNQTWVIRASGMQYDLYYGGQATAPEWPSLSSLTLVTARTTAVTRTFPNVAWGPRFVATTDNSNYLTIKRLRVFRSGVQNKSKRPAKAADHRLVVLCNDAAAPAADTGTQSSGSFTVSNGTPTFNQVGVFDGSIDFKRNSSNADEALVGPSSPAFSSGVTAITLMAWVYPTDSPTTAGYVIGKQKEATYSASTFTLGLGLSSTRLVLANGASITQASAGIAAPLNEWSHIACTYDGSNLITYLNGTLQTTVSDTSGLAWGDATEQARPWWIGNSPFPTDTNRRGFVGRISDVRAIARALTVAEIKDHVAHGFILVPIL